MIKTTKIIWKGIRPFLMSKTIQLAFLLCVCAAAGAQTNPFNPFDLDGDGILNVNDPDIDGDGVPNVDDLDNDNDGIYDTEENKGAVPILSGFKTLYPATIPSAGLVVGNRLLISSAITYTGIVYDAVLEVTSLSGMGSNGIVNLTADGKGNLSIQKGNPNENPYFTYSIKFVPTGTATATGAITPSTIPNVTVILGDIDGLGTSNRMGDIGGYKSSTDITKPPAVGSLLSPGGFQFGTSGINGPGATAYNYYRPTSLSATNGALRLDPGDSRSWLTITYDSYTVGDFVYGFTGTSTSESGERGPETYLGNVDLTDIDGNGVDNAYDLDSDGDGCSDSNEYYIDPNYAGQNMQFQQTVLYAHPPVYPNGTVNLPDATYPTGVPYIAVVTPTKVGNPSPLQQNVDIGATTTFSVMPEGVSGTYTTYQWQERVSATAPWTTISNTGVYSGANTNTLKITGILAGMNNYQYQLVLTDDALLGGNYMCGPLTSGVAKLKFNNIPPVAKNDVATVNEDTSVTINVVTNASGIDTDADGTVDAAMVDLDLAMSGIQKTFTITGQGTYTVDNAGLVTFVPVLNYNGSSTMNYTVNDNLGVVSNVATLTITINPVNDAPVAKNDVATTNEDTPATINVVTNVLGMDTDIDGTVDVTKVDLDPATTGIQTTFTITGQGTYTVNNAGLVTFVPVLNYNGIASPINYTVNDNLGLVSNIVTLTITVVAVNDAPVAKNDVATTNEDTSVTINVVTNASGIDTDVDGTVDAATVDLDLTTAGIQKTFTIIGQGTYTLDNAGLVTFVPVLNYNGSSTMNYTVNDNLGVVSNVATLTITINSVNDAPVAKNDVATTNEDTPATINVVTNVPGMDTDIDGMVDVTKVDLDPVTAGIQTTFTITGQGTYTVNNAGLVTFVPVLNYNGIASPINYTVNDNLGLVSNIATLTITVVAVNDAPVANNDAANTTKDTNVIVSVASNDTDIDGTINPATIDLDPLTTGIQTTFTVVGEGTYIANANGTITFDPLVSFAGTTTPVNYVIQDNQGGVSNSATITVNVISDSDGDGVLDKVEIADGTNPNDYCDSKQEHATLEHSAAFLGADCDNDGLTNEEEYGAKYGFPFDSNGDGMPDYLEVNTHNLSNSEDDLEIFNGISPLSDDPKNNVFTIRNIEKYPNNSLEIYNRWGVVVYQADGYGMGNKYFRGVSEGKSTITASAELPEGTYFYALKYVNAAGETKERSGYLYINR